MSDWFSLKSDWKLDNWIPLEYFSQQKINNLSNFWELIKLSTLKRMSFCVFVFLCLFIFFIRFMRTDRAEHSEEDVFLCFVFFSLSDLWELTRLRTPTRIVPVWSSQQQRNFFTVGRRRPIFFQIWKNVTDFNKAFNIYWFAFELELNETRYSGSKWQCRHVNSLL